MDVDGEDQDWLFLFKNETHNHPTEIEPFGGAATCIGGAIRDPLSGRSYVYQAMRVTGAADPTVARSPRPCRASCPQRKLVTTAAAGYSLLRQPDRPCHGAGQTSSTTPATWPSAWRSAPSWAPPPPTTCAARAPSPGDKIILLGGRTGRDGIGGATGSLQGPQRASPSRRDGAEVQKGNAPVERKLQRLFRRGDACRLIKRCNDFGAGGVSVAMGELADGLYIDLDQRHQEVRGPRRHRARHLREPGAHGRGRGGGRRRRVHGATRHEENLEATVIAEVTRRAARAHGLAWATSSSTSPASSSTQQRRAQAPCPRMSQTPSVWQPSLGRRQPRGAPATRS